MSSFAITRTKSITIELSYAAGASYWLKKPQWCASIFGGEIGRTGDNPEEALAAIGEYIDYRYPELLADLKEEASK